MSVSPKKMADAIRMLAIDSVQQANSGHPGMPMGMADIAVALWHRHLRHNPANPRWPNRDRFVLSNGHGSMLLYALLHLTGYNLPIDELRQFRQLHSKTAGHPEYGITPGVETTTGPLGQGLANAVGMAIAETLLAKEFNHPQYPLIDHYTYVFLGDGCLMEGISHEACSLAGTLRLNKLIALWDDNRISIDGNVAGWFTDDTPARFEAYGWRVIRDIDGHDIDAVDMAIACAKRADRPTLICCRTVIGKGSPNKQGGHDVHGSPLGMEEVIAVREALGWEYAPFEIPSAIYIAWDAREQGNQQENKWQQQFTAYAKEFPERARDFGRRIQGDLPVDFEQVVTKLLNECQTKAENIASRKASQNTIEALAAVLPEFIGGSADLTGSNLTNWSRSLGVRSQTWGNYISYGVREFGMSAIMNGIALHGGYLPFGGTFLTFSDYSRNALRMAALMKIRCIFVFTHDSIGLGEDGPTHQAVEHISSLRLIPNMDVWRPADTIETAVAWVAAIRRRDGPSSLILSRQNLPFISRHHEQITDIARGAYVLQDTHVKANLVLIATGSEVALALAAAKILDEQYRIQTRIVSMPSTTVFDRQDSAYKAHVLPASIPRVAVEAGVSDFWWKYQCAAVLSVDTFGESAPANILFKHFGFTVENLVEVAKKVVY